MILVEGVSLFIVSGRPNMSALLDNQLRRIMIAQFAGDEANDIMRV
ncbi:MAG: hypothetical protein WA421_17020 [Nitrososphaeraceae archaeon]